MSRLLGDCFPNSVSVVSTHVGGMVGFRVFGGGSSGYNVSSRVDRVAMAIKKFGSCSSCRDTSISCVSMAGIRSVTTGDGMAVGLTGGLAVLMERDGFSGMVVVSGGIGRGLIMRS